MQNVKNVLKGILLPKGLTFPLLFILGMPMLLMLWFTPFHRVSATAYVEMLGAMMIWAQLPGAFILNRITPITYPAETAWEGGLAYLTPIVIASALVYVILIKKDMLGSRAVWLAFCWSLFLIQVMGTLPMVYLWAIGV
ncbi:MAG: hypothetical protein GY832_00185 [Chloroflexi bacterium]|nr:hypothetical protein [Chloroflexota bacterium]